MLYTCVECISISNISCPLLIETLVGKKNEMLTTLSQMMSFIRDVYRYYGSLETDTPHTNGKNMCLMYIY